VQTAEEASAMLEPSAEWDLVLLDQKLPDGDGLQVLERMERLPRRPALVAISAHLQDSKRSLRLQGYPGVLLPKPFDRNDLLGAVSDALALASRERRDSEHPESRERRASGEQAALLTFGPISIHLVSQTVTIDGVPVDLQPAQFRILAQMLSNPGRPLAVSELAESALRGTHADGASNVRFQIHALRRRLGSAGKLIERSDGGYGVGLGTSPYARDSH
jgi:two-component system KDP operon response regulator KdpE